ncbi:MAG TPA: hypothetical protein VMJ35_04165 [Dongiaceae bacterium]|nr:hypothetical protein [Dongiaceae bacterium]
MQEVTPEGHRTTALALFQAGKYEEAVREFRAELDERENSENWNDWAAAETLCGRVGSGISGFLRALQLNPSNEEARENLAALRKQWLKWACAGQPGSNGIAEEGPSGTQTPDRAVSKGLASETR